MDIAIKRVMENGAPAIEVYINGMHIQNVREAAWHASVGFAPEVRLSLFPNTLYFIDEVAKT